MITLSIRDLVRNAAAVFSKAYGAVTRRAREVGCSRQTIYQHARQLQQCLQTPAPAAPAAEIPVPTPIPCLDQPTRRRFAVTAFAIGISTRQIEELLRIVLAEEGPDHSTIARWVKDAAQKAKPVLQALDAACIPVVQTLAVDEIFLGGDRLWSASSRRA
jgi:hypothetical protein